MNTTKIPPICEIKVFIDNWLWNKVVIPMLAIIGREDTKRNLNNPKKKILPTNLFFLKVSKLLIIKFELPATITPIEELFQKPNLKLQLKSKL